MTTSIRSWSTSAAGNNATVAGINFAEGQLPSTVNNSARELMAQIRQWYDPDEAGWIDHAGTASVNSQTVIRLAGDQTGALMPGRRVRLRGGSVAARYASVLSASFTSETTLTIADADGSLSASMTVVGLATATPASLPRRVDKLDVSATISVGGALVADRYVQYKAAWPKNFTETAFYLPTYGNTASASAAMTAINPGFDSGFCWLDSVNFRLVIRHGAGLWRFINLS